MFRVTLVGYAYTFIGKGTVPEFLAELQHGAAVYQWLRPLQGVWRPCILRGGGSRVALLL